MSNCPWDLLLLAERTPWRSMSSRLQGRRAQFDSADVVAGLIILIGMVLGAILLTRLLPRQDRQRYHHHPWGLFRALCRAHGLDRSSQGLLRQLARSHQLEHPARMFVEPQWLEISQLAPSLKTQLGKKLSLLETIRSRIFQSPQGNTD